MKRYHLLQFFFIIYIIEIAPALEDNTAEKTLRLVNILYRHGDRSPIKFYPYDSYKNDYKKYWPEGLGQLTKRGKYMEYELGAWLRNRYKDFISSVFVPEEVRVVSTDVDRTLMSAECVLASFYYPDNNTIFNKLILWTPTPIHTAPAEVDKLLNVDKSCPRIEEEEGKVKMMPEVKQFIEDHQNLFKFLTEKVGQTINTVREGGYLFDTLKIEKLYDLKLPDWAEEKYSLLKKVGDFSFKMNSYSKELKRLRGGPLVSYIVNNMRNKIAGKDEKKLYMFSAHDSTVAVLLNSLGVFNNKAPPYAATVIIELHEVNGRHIVKTFYQNDSMLLTPPIALWLPGCTIDCPFEKWDSLAQKIIPEDWEKECLHVDSTRDFYFLLLFTGIFFILCSIFALVGISYQQLRQCCEKDDSEECAYNYHTLHSQDEL